MFRKLKPLHKRIVLDIAGWLFIVFGIVGIFMPFLQGLLFIVIGSYLLSLHSPWFHTKLHKLKTKYPKILGPLDRMDTWVRHHFGLELNDANS